MNTDEHGLNLLSEKVLGAVFEVSNTLGAGFLEKVYERALLIELNTRGIQTTAQTSLAVTYKGRTIGEYFADILVEGVLVIELKCVDHLANEHMAQCPTICGLPAGRSAFLSISKSPRLNGNALFFDRCSSVFICG
jgi:GxxExxY protein